MPTRLQRNSASARTDDFPTLAHRGDIRPKGAAGEIWHLRAAGNIRSAVAAGEIRPSGAEISIRPKGAAGEIRPPKGRREYLTRGVKIREGS